MVYLPGLNSENDLVLSLEIALEVGPPLLSCDPAASMRFFAALCSRLYDLAALNLFLKELIRVRLFFRRPLILAGLIVTSKKTKLDCMKSTKKYLLTDFILLLQNNKYDLSDNKKKYFLSNGKVSNLAEMGPKKRKFCFNKKYQSVEI